MSLAAMNWRYVGSSAFGSATCPAVLDAIWAVLQATTYPVDATTRTPGSGSAWSWSRYQNGGVTEALYGTPPTSTLGHKVIIGGSSSGAPGGTFTLLSPDVTPVTNQLHVGIAKNAGAFATWNSTAPFTTGEFSNYWRIWATSAGTGTVYVFEGIEGVIVLISAGAAMYGFAAGALLDCEGGDTITDSESDGKLYCMFTSGITSAMSTSFWSTAASCWLFPSATNSQAHGGVFTPGSATILTVTSGMNIPAVGTATFMKTRSGRYGRAPVFIRASAAAPNDTFLGRLRNLTMFTRAITPQYIPSVGYVVSTSNSSASDCLFAEHG
jgi:hypothetical protein